MTNIQQKTSDYVNNIEERCQNSLLFEHSSIIKPYFNKNLKYFKDTERELNICEPLLMRKYIKELRKSARRIYLTQKEADNYYKDPKRFSLEKLGSIDYWYVVLCLNRMFSVDDFHSFKNGVLIPDMSQISNILQTEMQNKAEINKKINKLNK